MEVRGYCDGGMNRQRSSGPAAADMVALTLALAAVICAIVLRCGGHR
jgi:hypothetical protein